MIKINKENKSFSGFVQYYSHDSVMTKTKMNFSVFVPQKARTQNVPVLFWLSGLTCTEENFMSKAGAQKYADREGLMIVCPDTSPRDTGIAGENDDWDLGSGAGFYVNATVEPWQTHYQMYDYVVKELPDLIAKHFSVDMNRLSISGHSMGGHGALVIALRNPMMFKSVSAFAPLCAATQCSLGQKAFRSYLNDDKSTWLQYDASEQIKMCRTQLPLLVDQGLNDEFLAEQLRTDVLKAACREVDYKAEIRMQPGYDHSYYFIASFIEDHIQFHSQFLKK